MSHHHSIFCILPPYMLDQIVQNGSSAQRNRAVQMIASARVIRERRQSLALALTPIDRTTIANFYISHKTKPLTILAGPKYCGKIALVQCLARTLVGDAYHQCQVMAGHPWSFGNSENLALFIKCSNALQHGEITLLD